MSEFDYIKREFKKLGSMILIGIGIFLIINGISNQVILILVGVGTFLLLEHIYTYGKINLLDILGHEWIGLISLFSGFLMINSFTQGFFQEFSKGLGLFIFLIGCLIANDWGFNLKEGWKEMKEKVKYLFKI